MIPILFFPYEDEILYSFVSRYHKYIGYEQSNLTMDELYGKSFKLSIHYPQNVADLVSMLPNHELLEEEALLNNNTLLPILKPFVDNEVYQNAKKALLFTGAGVIKKVGFTYENIFSADKDKIKVCPLCYNEDIEKHGEAYIHRMHNYIGSVTCHIHNCFLDEIQFIYTKSKELIDINDANIYKPQEPEYPDNVSSKLYCDLNSDVYNILNGKLSKYNIDKLYKRYQNKHIELGVYTVKLTKDNPIIKGFDDYYPVNFLVSLESQIDEESSWLRRALYQPNHKTNPIRHLIIIRYLFGGVDKFASNTEKFEPFGSSPFPCLNKNCDEHSGNSIKQVSIALSNNKKGLTGTFQCPICGFTYTRKTTHKDADNKYKYSYLKDRGHLWKDTLCQLIEKEDLSLKELGRRLNADPKEIKRHALTLGYDDWLQGKVRKDTSTEYTGRILKEVDLSLYKKEILNYIKSKPEVTRTEIRKNLGSAVYNLRKYDNQWLLNNLPNQKQGGRWMGDSYNKEFWGTREEELIPLFKEAIEKIKQNDNLGNITWTELKLRTNTVGSQPDLHLDKMPSLAKLVKDNLTKGK